MLNLIQDSAIGQPGEKTARIFLGELAGIEIFQADVFLVGKDLAAQGCSSGTLRYQMKKFGLG